MLFDKLGTMCVAADELSNANEGESVGEAGSEDEAESEDNEETLAKEQETSLFDELKYAYPDSR